MKSICVDRIKESKNNGIEYGMVKISIYDKESFGMFVLDDDFSFESLGNDYIQAVERFNVLSKNNVSSLHLEEVLHDIKMKIYF